MTAAEAEAENRMGGEATVSGGPASGGDTSGGDTATGRSRPGRPAPRLRLAAGPIGVVVPRRTALVIGLCLVFLVAGTVASVSLGTYHLPLGDVVDGLLGDRDGPGYLVVHTLRLPRVLTAILAGLALGLAGAVFQAVTRNPLAGPDLLGISAGAGAGAVGAILFGGVTAAEAGSYGAVPVGAMIGAVTAAAVIYLLAYRDGNVSGLRFVLIGLAVQGAATAGTRWMLARADIDQASRAMVWLTGSLNGRGYEHVRWVGIALAVLAPGLLALARPFAMLQYDDDTSRALGIRVGGTRLGLLLPATGLTAAAVCAAGPIAFLALAAPQIARRLTGAPGVPLVTSGIVGAVALVGADLAARTVFSPVELPVGIVTGAVGAPYLMWLLARERRAG